MDPKQLARNLASNAERVCSLVEGMTEEAARWKPDPQSWSILEVINHLLDEERFDFRVRLDIILHRPNEPLPPIDPQGWVSARRYNENDLNETLKSYLAERQASLTWLAGLGDADWQASITNQWGNITAGNMLAAWATHDILHMRQLVELHYALMVEAVKPYDGIYAGEW
jgi:hypothetical protein